ncbi:hypothetical protein PISMIDRAFT_18721 [Pisolithus microcarpus 441]|uniref:Uncharacterized protein n=1 Tax=Pisolithus microcarpus 441 TaxID=765257 RepID=A0A0C9Y6B3_9AGAM|nr:hypothetical protein PISMIDRAFT_18721 [Pisolithus microcarpus 441]
MDYRPYYPPITLRKTFNKDRTPSPSASEITLRRVFDFEVVHSVEKDNEPPNLDPNILVPRPRGPLSKPNHGGYTLRHALGWDDKTYKEVQEGLHGVCDKYLDTSTTFPKQTSNAVSKFLQAAREQFPILGKYVDLWPAGDFATMYLKNKVGSDRAKTRVRTDK